MTQQTKKATAGPGIESKVVRDVLTFLALSLEPYKLQLVMEELTRRGEQSVGLEKSNYLKVVRMLEKVIEQPEVAQEEQVAVPSSVTAVAVIPSQVTLPITALPIAKSVIQIPKKKEKTKKLVVSSIELAHETELLLRPLAEQAGLKELEEFSKVPFDRNLLIPWIRVVTIHTPEGQPYKILLVGTASGYINTQYQNICCTVDGMIQNTNNPSLLWKASDGRICLFSRKFAVPQTDTPEVRWMRVVKYEDGRLFHYWRRDPTLLRDEEKQYYRISADTVENISSEDYTQLLRMRVAARQVVPTLANMPF